MAKEVAQTVHDVLLDGGESRGIIDALVQENQDSLADLPLVPDHHRAVWG